MKVESFGCNKEFKIFSPADLKGTKNSNLENSFPYYETFLGSYKQDRAIIYSLRSEHMERSLTLCQDFLYQSKLFGIRAEPMAEIQLKDNEVMIKISNDLISERVKQVKLFMGSIETLSRMRDFLDVPLNFFPFEELHETGSIFEELPKDKPLVSALIGSLIKAACNECKEMLINTEEKLKELPKEEDLDYTRNIDFLWGIAEGFDKYFTTVVSLDDNLSLIKDVINETAHKFGIKDSQFSLWETLTKVYKETFYRKMGIILRLKFVKSMENLLCAFPRFGISEENIDKVLKEEYPSKLKKIADYLNDMAVDKSSILSIKKFEGPLASGSLVGDLVESIQRVANCLFEYPNHKLILEVFLKKTFIPQIYEILVKCISKFP